MLRYYRLKDLLLGIGVAYLQTKGMVVILRPGVAPVQHVQHHAAAAPHVHLGVAALPQDHLWSHVCLCARHVVPYQHRNESSLCANQTAVPPLGRWGSLPGSSVKRERSQLHPTAASKAPRPHRPHPLGNVLICLSQGTWEGNYNPPLVNTALGNTSSSFTIPLPRNQGGILPLVEAGILSQLFNEVTGAPS